ncbi:ATP-dependent Clp protease proteolytic subunit [candidate division WOR-3 bacterium]|jgi:ATP-dependent Clp protease protease subunit|nr:ATP-dependent Clp protease proteolytic subunit [candidate division WOR-3 bacterium]
MHNTISVPYVIEKTVHGERVYDIYSRLLKERIIFIGSSIDEFVANSIIAQLLYLESQAPDKEISLYINSVGGSVSDGLAVYDTMQFIRSPVCTISIGISASIAAVLLTAGKKGRRFALPNSRILLHQPSGGISGVASDIEIHADEIIKMRERINKILSVYTGQQIKKIKSDTDRDFWMDAEQACEYGLIDEVIKSRKEINEKGV